MNAFDLKKLKDWRENEEADGPVPLWEIDTPLALALHDFMRILGVGEEDMRAIMGEDNWATYQAFISEEIPEMDEPTRAYRLAKALFEPESDLEEYGLMPTALSFPDAIWDALEENVDDRLIFLGPIILDQDTRKIWLAEATNLEAMRPGMTLECEQISAATKAMREADGR